MNDTDTNSGNVETSKPVVLPSTKVSDWLRDRRAALDHIRVNKHDLTMEFLKENGLPVFVKNTVRTGQVLLVSIIDASGRRTSHRIEKTWIPQNLSDRYSYETLMRCDDLKDMIFRRAVVLVHPEDAIKELESPRAREVLKKFHSRFAGEVPNEDSVPEKSGEVTEKMKMLVHRINTGDLKGDDAVNEVINNFITFTASDFYYMYERFSSRPEFEYIVSEVRTEAVRQGLHK